MKISVIAIFYNSSSYIDKCIQSIISQENVKLELIAVDDCSSDDTLDILQKYALCDNRIHIIHHDTNKGISYSRNSGMKIVNGDCFYFIDGDDYLPKGALSNLMKYFSNEVDWVEGAYEILNENNKVIGYKNRISGIYSSHDEISKHFFDIEFTWTHNKLINKKYSNLMFPEDRVHEDQFWNINVYSKLNKIVSISEITYCYIKRNKSFSRSQCLKRKFIDDGMSLLEIMSKEDQNWLYRAQSIAVGTIVKYLYLSNNFDSEYRKHIITKLFQLRIFPISINIDNYPRFSYFLYKIIDAPEIVRRNYANIYRILMNMINKPIL